MNKSWEYKRIGDVCTVERGGSPRPIDDYITDNPNEINWIKIGDTSDSMYITHTAQKIIPEGMKKSRYVQSGDFLLSNSMSFGRPYILKIDGCIHDGWLVLRDKKGVFDKRFLYYYLSARPTYEKFKSMAVGGVVNNLNSEMVRKVNVPLPPVSEQIQVSDLLDKANRIIEKRKRQLSSLNDLVKARFFEMFGDPEAGTCHFRTERLGDLAIKISDGVHAKPDYTEYGKPILSVVNINKGFVDFTDCKYVSEEAYQKMIRSTHPQIGDVLYTKVGATYGIPAYVDTEREFCLYVSVCLIKPSHEKINARFLAFQMAMPSIKHQADARIKGIGVPDLHLNQISEFRIICPPRDLQDSFVQFVEQIDKSKSAIQKSLEETQLLFDSLMQKYFN